jgi:hypothetical protein
MHTDIDTLSGIRKKDPNVKREKTVHTLHRAATVFDGAITGISQYLKNQSNIIGREMSCHIIDLKSRSAFVQVMRSAYGYQAPILSERRGTDHTILMPHQLIRIKK